MEESRLKTYSPLTFAFLGDAVFALFMREYVVRLGNMSAHKMHLKTIDLLSANAQEKAIMKILEGDILTGEEKDIYKRGENTKTVTHAKNASDVTYHRATGFECLIGWLYLREEHERIKELLTKAIEINNEI